MDDKIPFYALDLRNISWLVKTKTKTRTQCLMVNTGSLINQLKVAFITQSSNMQKIIPVFKNKEELDPNNYRPISRLSVFSRIFEKFMYKRLKSFTDK